LKVVVFEDEGWSAFAPVTRLRHTSQLRWGTRTLLESLVEKIPDATDVALWGRPGLAEVSREGLGREYNPSVHGPAFFVNARARPSGDLLTLASRQEPFVAVVGGSMVAARMSGSWARPGVLTARDVVRLAKRTDKLAPQPDSLFDGYWDLVESNGLAVAEQSRRPEDPQSLPVSVEVRGPATNVMVAGGADLESHVTLDARLGPIVIGEGASVESFSRLMGPCYIGAKTRVYSAQVGGGTSVFDQCKVGGQVENSIIMPHTNKAHFGYAGDTYVGEWVNLGAGCTFSNLKNTYGNVRVDLGGKRVDSGKLKLGPMVGDMCKVSIGALVFAGKMLGTGSQVTGLVKGNVPSFAYLDGGSGSATELLIDSVVETQRRMMERRGLALSRRLEGLIRRAFVDTSGERKKGGVKRGRIG
jgi:UDP-N-acetylglucosamine diphosphorylase/glucosamine-1-phosphate N-acetyltransferase